MPQKVIFSLANNHLGDHGEMGVLATRYFLEKMGIRHFGAQLGESEPVEIVERDGVRLGLFGWTQWMNREVLHNLPRAYRYDELRRHDWRALKKQHDLHTLIGAPHWQLEFRHFPSAEAREIAQEMAAAGFDLILAHHPHVPGPVERFETAWCCYSLGNLVGVHWSWPTKMAAVLELQIVSRGVETGALAAAIMHPFFFEKKGDRKTVVPLSSLAGALRQKLEKRWELLNPKSHSTG